MSMEFWSTVQRCTGDMRHTLTNHSGEHAMSLISPNARANAEANAEGISCYKKSSVHGSPWEMTCQLRVSESLNAAQRFLPCPSNWDMNFSDVARTGDRRSLLTMRQFAVAGIDLPLCFDWWINRHTASLPLSLAIKTSHGEVHLPTDRFGNSLVSLAFFGEGALHPTQVSGVLPSAQTLRLAGVKEVTTSTLLPFPKLERLYVEESDIHLTEMRVDFDALQTSDITSALSPFEHLQHLFINDCSRVRLPELPMLFSCLRSLSLRGSRLERPLRFPPEMPLLTHLDLFVQNPELIRQVPHCPNLRILALHNLHIAVLRTMLNRSLSLRQLEGTINDTDSFDITGWEPFISVVEVLRIHYSPQLKHLTFPNCGSLVNLRKVDLSGNRDLSTLDVSGCTNLTELQLNRCVELRKVLGIGGLENIETLYTYWCTRLGTLDVSGCINLRELKCHRCNAMREIKGLAGLEKLEILHTYQNQALTTLDVSGCVNLRALNCHSCLNMRAVVDLAGLGKLMTVSAYDTPLTILDVSGCVNLRELKCHRCNAMREITGLAGLEKLEILHTYQNHALTTLDVSGCVNLRELKCHRCSAMREITGLAVLEKLEILHTYLNVELTTLDVSGCENLKDFRRQTSAKLRHKVHPGGSLC